MICLNDQGGGGAGGGPGGGGGTGGDETVIDGAMVNGSAHLVGWFSGVARRLQTGYLYHYALAMLVGVVFLMSWFISWPMLHDWLRK
ncbi:MAG: NADH-ubiquinone oxidoreductase chain L [uncultured Ramlibacter sp.]|uniref:NADH-ubiquinone oxidoreductase chain L n=1 Tax=uncultured Ramlibacter sp. TaxID=260755 RepID=A0A6J4PZL9_9BURK|nr:MAG: NADH-ubiquinone oxidoreductase chain L [uncultured Ramlibacter sp.]